MLHLSPWSLPSHSFLSRLIFPWLHLLYFHRLLSSFLFHLLPSLEILPFPYPQSFRYLLSQFPSFLLRPLMFLPFLLRLFPPSCLPLHLHPSFPPSSSFRLLRFPHSSEQ